MTGLMRRAVIALPVMSGVVSLVSLSEFDEPVSDAATLTVINPNPPPVASPDTFDAIGNVTVPVAAPGVLTNVVDAEGGHRVRVAIDAAGLTTA